MGGDEVYPVASSDNYQKKLRDPYDWAFPDPHPKLLKGPPVYALPGNHDWYDGLVLFLALFSRREHLHLGGWRTHQRRSYFALQLTPSWWIWAIDSQLDDDMDQPQKEYFVAIAKQMPEGSNVILCGPEPGWLYTLQLGSKSFSIIDYAGWIALEHCKGAAMPLVLSGDTHHYSRYEGNDGTTHFITSGGGGAFLHPTHQLKRSVDVNRPQDNITWLRGDVTSLALGSSTNTDGTKKEACYPTRAESMTMLKGNFAFAVTNPGFGLVLGAVYWLVALLGVALPIDIRWLAPVLLFLGFWAYTKHQEGAGPTVFIISVFNGLVHGAGALAIGAVFGWFNSQFEFLESWPRLSFVLFGAEVILVGGWIAAELFGIYLYLSSGYLDLNHNDAFSSMRLDSHRHFLRIRITDDDLTVFPIALDCVPRRNQWRNNLERRGSPAPAFVPESALSPKLVEPPIVIKRAAKPSVSN